MKKLEQPVFNLNQTVAQEHVLFFRRYGVIQFKNFIPIETVKDFINEIKGVETFLLQKNVTRINGVPLKFGTDIDGSAIIQGMAFASQYSETLSKFLRSERLHSLTRLLEQGKDGCTCSPNGGPF